MYQIISLIGNMMYVSTLSTDSKSLKSEVEHASPRSQRLHTILNLYEWTERKHFVSWQPEYREQGMNPDLWRDS